MPGRLAPVTRKHSPDTVLIVDGTPVPTHDRSISASSKNYRYSAYTDSRVDAQCRGAKVMGGGGYQGNPEVIMPCRRPREGQPPLPRGKEDLNTVHKSVHARVEHTLAHMKSWNILRNCRRTRDDL